jgi:hypothetical protein
MPGRRSERSADLQSVRPPAVPTGVPNLRSGRPQAPRIRNLSPLHHEPLPRHRASYVARPRHSGNALIYSGTCDAQKNRSIRENVRRRNGIERAPATGLAPNLTSYETRIRFQIHGSVRARFHVCPFAGFVSGAECIRPSRRASWDYGDIHDPGRCGRYERRRLLRPCRKADPHHNGHGSANFAEWNDHML